MKKELPAKRGEMKACDGTSEFGRCSELASHFTVTWSRTSVPFMTAEKKNTNNFDVVPCSTYSNLSPFILLPTPLHIRSSHSTHVLSATRALCSTGDVKMIVGDVKMIVLDLFRVIALKVHDDVWADESELYLGQLEAFRDLFDMMQPRARLEDLLCAYLAPLRLDLTAFAPRRVGRSLMSNGLRTKNWRWRPSASPGSLRSIWRRGDILLYFEGILLLYVYAVPFSPRCMSPGCGQITVKIGQFRIAVNQMQDD